MHDYECFRQDLRKTYYSKYVKERFNEALEMIGAPKDGDRFAFITARPKGNAGWYECNNAMNAFEFKLNRKLWRRRSRKEKIPNVGSIEPDASFHKYHFHYLVNLKELKMLLTDDEIRSIIIRQLKELKEINSKDPNALDVFVFTFDNFKQNSRDDAFGTSIHYLVKSSSKHHNPLEKEVYSHKEQQSNYEKNTSTYTYISQE